MLTEIEKAYLTDLLQTLDLGDLIDLAKRMTGGIIIPSTMNDSINAILLHTPDVKTLMGKKKITKAFLFKYLHNKNVSFPGNAEKLTLIDLVIQYWQKNTVVPTQQPTNFTTEISNLPQNSDDLDLKALAVQFVEWFYNRINSTIIHLKTNDSYNNFEKLKVDDFWSDAKIIIKVTRGSGEVIASYSSESSEECLKLISNCCVEHTIFFSPNLREEGTRGVSEPHGMVLVMSCGTLHSISGHQCVGLYEQIFGLIKDPIRNNWKIKYSKLNLRSQDVKSVPALPECNKFLCDF